MMSAADASARAQEKRRRADLEARRRFLDLPLREQAASWLKNPSQTWTDWKGARRRRKSQKWDAMGATALKVALRDTTLVDAAWLVELAATEGGIVPRCQDVPKHAKVSLKEMEKWPGHPPSVAVLVIS